MKLEIDKKDLLGLIGKTQNIVEKRNTMPVLVNVLLEAADGILRVYATDLEVSLTDAVKTKVIEPGKVAVSAKNLFEVAKELGFKSIIVLGHEHYYPKFGFEPAEKWNIKAPFEVPSNVFMAIELVPDGLKNITGIVNYAKEFETV